MKLMFDETDEVDEMDAAAEIQMLRYIRSRFISRMNGELADNTHRKGDWRSWEPTELLLVSELNWHLAKLIKAFERGDTRAISEYSADLANYAMKSDEIYGIDGINERRRLEAEVIPPIEFET